MSGEQVPPRDSWDPIDEALYGPEDLYKVKAEEADRLRLGAVRSSLNRHYTRNRFYNTLCKQRGVTPEDFKKLDDLAKVPLVADAIFKQYPEPGKFVAWLRGISCDDVKYPKIEGSSYQELIDRLNEYGLKVIFSSGTSGRSSFFPRDQIALEREKHFRLHHYRFLGHDPEEYVVQLGPDYRKIHPNWVIAHTAGNDDRRFHKEDRIHHMVSIDATTDTVHTVMGQSGQMGRFQAKDKLKLLKEQAREANSLTAQILEDLNKKGAKGKIGGTPPLLNDFLSWMENSGERLSLGDRWIIETGGGGLVSPETLYNRVERVLGIPSENCRDIYGLSESTVSFPSCEGHYYHIVHTLLHPFVLDDELEPVGYGEFGRFGFIDPLAHAYPGCIITGDRIKLLESCPSCDRPGPVISSPITRAPGAEDRGCGATVRKLMAEVTDGA